MAAAFDLPFTDPADAGSCRTAAEGGWPVTIADPIGCGRFVTVRVTGINPAAPSPFWLRRRLSAAGIRSISLAVDVTNYVMIDLGQPLHAFDAGKLTGAITVRRAADGETLRHPGRCQAHPGRRRPGRQPTSPARSRWPA